MNTSVLVIRHLLTHAIAYIVFLDMTGKEAIKTSSLCLPSVPLHVIGYISTPSLRVRHVIEDNDLQGFPCLHDANGLTEERKATGAHKKPQQSGPAYLTSEELRRKSMKSKPSKHMILRDDTGATGQQGSAT